LLCELLPFFTSPVIYFSLVWPVFYRVTIPVLLRLQFAMGEHQLL